MPKSLVFALLITGCATVGEPARDPIAFPPHLRLTPASLGQLAGCLDHGRSIGLCGFSSKAELTRFWVGC